eukprot:TRINITY_DN6690_c0_g1_i6.p1 TRINITY_DN6690_c0_g1~~TRINITY_DN6690_c0_g1_i6.p1  ORF type:complete len:338 (+),score=11.88 TRINITY_DN6690_c0_g1_i6:451-1464(+)
MVQRLGFSPETVEEHSLDLYRRYGTTMAGLRAEGYRFDFDDWHEFVHGRLPYDVLKPDPALRALIESLPQRKFILTNADRKHAARCIDILGLEGCFDKVIAVEDLTEHRPFLPFAQRDVFGRPGQLPGSQASGGSSGSSSPLNLSPSSSSPPVPEQASEATMAIRCTSRRCISVDSLVDHCTAQSLAAATVSGTAGASAAGKSGGRRLEGLPPLHRPHQSNLTVASWHSDAGPLVCCKPQAEAFHRALAIAGADPHTSIFFDDSFRNIAAAKSFGLRTVLVGTSQRSPESDYALSDIHELKLKLPFLWQKGVVDGEENHVDDPCICHLMASQVLVQA